MMSNPAYFILEIDIHDHDAMKPYLEKAGATLKPFGGVALVSSDSNDTVEGAAPKHKVVMLRFPSMTDARAWYDSAAYRAILGHRLRAGDNRGYFVEGLAA